MPDNNQINGHALAMLDPELSWRKSQYSNPSGNCVELAMTLGGHVAIRDSHDPNGGVLVLERTAFNGFLATATAGRASSAAMN